MPVGHTLAADGIRVHGLGGTRCKKRSQRLARRVTQVFELREQGMNKKEIAKTCHMSPDNVEAILHDPDHIRRRLTSYNERLRSACPLAINVVFETLNDQSPTMRGERARMAQWVLEMTKTVGKDAPVNIFLNANNAQVNVNQEMLEAARVAASQLRATIVSPALPPAPVIESIPIPQEENSDGNSTVTVDVNDTRGSDTTTLPPVGTEPV